MNLEISRIRVLSGPLTAIALAVALSACSDNSKETGDAGKAPETPAASDTAKTEPAAPAARAVKVPDPEGEVDMAKLMAPGPLPEMALGSEDAPVTVIEYASMTCGHCRYFDENTWPELKKAYVDTGKIRFIMREFPLDPRATAAIMLARCSSDNYFPLVDVLFRRQDEWAGAPQEKAAEALFQTVKIAGFSQESFDACLKDQQLLDNVNATRKRAADDFGVEATPTFFINGKKYPGALPFEEIAAIIDSMG